MDDAPTITIESELLVRLEDLLRPSGSKEQLRLKKKSKEESEKSKEKKERKKAKQQLKLHWAVERAFEVNKNAKRRAAVRKEARDVDGPQKTQKNRFSRLGIDDLDGVTYRFLPVPEHLKKRSQILDAMPRRRMAQADPAFGMPPREKPTSFKPSFFEVIARLTVWVLAFYRFRLGDLWDQLRRRSSEERRARRLVDTMQNIGGTVVKIGQQLSMRVDLLPYVYCKEFARLLDSQRPFPAEIAIETIERAHGRPLHEVFQRFDPTPIGSASIACVYQAVLKDGTKVAVKVRRPKIGKLFAADLQAIKWIVSIAESLTLMRAGLMTNFVKDLHDTLMDELDFKKELRQQEFFRREVRKNKLNKRHHYLTAPRPIFDLSTSNVLIQEFSSGIWMWEIIAAVEQQDEAALARMRELNIDPKVLAKRVIWAQSVGTGSELLYHADPHPANIVVKANNQLVFIDFGSCGVRSSDQLTADREIGYHLARKDIRAIVQIMLRLMEPMPPIDVHEFQKALERNYFETALPQWSKQSEWYERTSAAGWITFFEMTRQYELPANPDVVRAFRANLLYDIVALRLDPDLNMLDARHEIDKTVSKMVAKDVKRDLSRWFKRGFRDQDYVMLRNALGIGVQGLFTAQRFLEKPSIAFSYMIEKSALAVLVITRFVLTSVAILLIWSGVVSIIRFTQGYRSHFNQVAWDVATAWQFHILIGILLLLSVRRITVRLGDKKTD
jgi:predicted unusual protein kinase regulating ubiquinone biosynthesis (AarF/ABC1/UbiB family)